MQSKQPLDPVPDPVWDVVIAMAGPDAAYGVAIAADRAGRAEQAETLFRRAADAGSYRSMTELGIRYITTSRETDATDWLRKAATAGNGDAMIALAYLASRADNSEEANAWLTKATSANCDPLLLASFALLAKTTPPTDVTDDWLQIAASINEPKIAAALRRITNR